MKRLGLAGLTLLAGLTSMVACGRGVTGSGSAGGTLAGTSWSLVEIGGAAAPTGAGGRPATLIFTDSVRAGGFSGCNRAGGDYTVRGDSLRFGALIMTKMACDAGMDLERSYAEALEATRRFRVERDVLELIGESGIVAKFRRDTTSSR